MRSISVALMASAAAALIDPPISAALRDELIIDSVILMEALEDAHG